MTRAMSRIVLAAAVVCLTAVVSLAQQTTTTSETKTFEVLAVDGNQLVVRLPEGTRELTVPDDFRFIVNGQPLSVRELKAGMKGTATITTRTTVTPVTVTEVKNGTVVVRSGSTIIVRTDEGVQSFTQGEVDKRGVKIMRDGKPAQVSDFREGDRLSATIITSLPPRVMTEKEVQATLANAGTAAGGGGRGWRRGQTSRCTKPVDSQHGSTSGSDSGGSPGRPNAAEHRQLVAAPRVRERHVACDRTRPDSQAALRPLSDAPREARALSGPREIPLIRLSHPAASRRPDRPRSATRLRPGARRTRWLRPDAPP